MMEEQCKNSNSIYYKNMFKIFFRLIQVHLKNAMTCVTPMWDVAGLALTLINLYVTSSKIAQLWTKVVTLVSAAVFSAKLKQVRMNYLKLKKGNSKKFLNIDVENFTRY
jgi:hypothetical protein